LITVYGGAAKVREILAAARRVAMHKHAPICSIVWIESPSRGRALMLARETDITPETKFPFKNRLALIGDLDTGEVVSSTLTRWLEARGRTTDYPGQWKRLMPDRDNLATGQALTYFAALPRF
jgi:hypothetical protein